MNDTVFIRHATRSRRGCGSPCLSDVAPTHYYYEGFARSTSEESSKMETRVDSILQHQRPIRIK